MDRKASLIRLAEFYGLETVKRERYSTSADEDIAEYLHEDRAIGRFVAITKHGDHHYLYPQDALEDAVSEATTNLLDSTYEEIPIGIVDLDAGTELPPVGVRIEWGESIPARHLMHDGARHPCA